MDFQLNEEQQMLRDMVERFATQQYPAADRPGMTIPAEGFVPGNWNLLAELGLLAMPFDADIGGPVELMVVMEALGKGVVAEPFLTGPVMAGTLIARAGTAAQQDQWLDRVMTGEAHIALAFAEPHTRFAWDRAEARVAGGKLSGEKTFVIAGSACQAYIVTAMGEDGGLGLWLVEADAPGMELHRYRLIDGSPAVAITFTDTPAEPMAGGVEALAAHVDAMRVPIAAEMVGLMQTLFDMTVEYLKIRKQFGVAIGSFQALQHRMVDQYLALEQSRSLLLRAALTTGAEGEAARLAAKSYISRAAIGLGEEAIQLHGGMGVTDELVIGHAHKRVLLLASLFGDAEAEAGRYLAAVA